MKKILFILSLLAFAFTPNVELISQDHEIKIDPTQDKDSVYIMLSENQVGKYRQGRGKWTNYEDWKGVLTDSIYAVVRQEISDSIATVGGGGGLSYYEVTFTFCTDGTASNHTLTIINNTFPEGWTAQEVSSTAINLVYNNSSLDFATNIANCYATTGCTFNIVTSHQVCAQGGIPDGSTTISWTLTDAGTAVNLGGADAIQCEFIYPLYLSFRYYHE